MTFEQFVSIVRARWRISVAIFLAIVGFALIVSLLLPKQYTAVATLLVDIRASDPVDNQENPVDLQPTFVATQVEVVKSDRVARRVIQLLKLDQDPGWQKAWRKDTNGKGDFAVWAAGVFARKLAVTPSQQSTVINVSYTDSDPSGSARMADAFAQAYLDTNLELQVEPARRYAAWFSDKSNDLRANLEKAQRRLTSYQKEHGIPATTDTMSRQRAFRNFQTNFHWFRRTRRMFLREPRLQRMSPRMSYKIRLCSPCVKTLSSNRRS